MKPEKGILYLVPSPIGETDLQLVIPSKVMHLLTTINYVVAEELRTVRRYLSKAGLKGKIDSLQIYELNEHTPQEMVESYLKILLEGHDIALISEAGLPAVADPGANLVSLAHGHDIKVVPLSGPSSLMMALMASGLNGQCFAFTGYLPAKSDERKEKIKLIERVSMQLKQSQIVIETPYRNQALFNDFVALCNPSTKLCVAAEITSENEFIKTKSIAQWRKNPIEIGKRPCVFVLMA